MLRRQLDRLAERGLTAQVGTELEFIVFADSFDVAWRKGYRELEPANLYNVDYSLLGTGRIEPLLRAIRNGMTGAGMTVESAKGECNLGQHEIAFRYADLRQPQHLQDRRQGDRRPGQDEPLTFMAKYDQREGDSCHIHISLRGDDGEPVLSGNGPHGFSPLMEYFLAGDDAAFITVSTFLVDGGISGAYVTPL